MKTLTFRFRGGEWHCGKKVYIMGIVNVTPDSFSDGGLYQDTGSAVQHGIALVEAGADVLDIGGESTRPGAAPVSEEEECRRVVPVIRDLCRHVDVPISVDTCKAAVAAAAVDAGAAIINDVTGLQRDKQMIEVVRDSGAGCIIMHMRGTPATMSDLTAYSDLTADICAYFNDIIANAVKHGIDFEQIMLDPGIGFAKTAEQNLELIAHCAQFRELERPVLMGPSRKSFIGKILGHSEPENRLWGTAAAVACCVMAGADVLRVHDVRAMKDVAMMTKAIQVFLLEK